MGFNSKMNWYLSMVKERMEGLVKIKIRSKLNKQRNHSKKVECNFCKTLHFSYSSSSDSSSSSGSSSGSRRGKVINSQLENFDDFGAEKVVGMPPPCSFKVEEYKYTSKDMEEILKSQDGYNKTDQGNKIQQKSNRLSGWVKCPDERKAKKKRNGILHQPRKCK